MILPIDQSGPGSWSLVSFHFLVTLNNTYWNNLEGRWWALGVVFAPWSEEMNHQNLQSKVGARAFESFLRQRRHSCRHLKYDVISFILKPQLPKVRSLHAQRRCRNDFRSSAPTSTSYIGWSLTGLICILRHYRGVTQLSCQGRCPEQSLLSHFRHLEPRRTRCFQSLYSFGQKSLKTWWSEFVSSNMADSCWGNSLRCLLHRHGGQVCSR